LSAISLDVIFSSRHREAARVLWHPVLLFNAKIQVSRAS
jgi:hypothetical protein